MHTASARQRRLQSTHVGGRREQWLSDRLLAVQAWLHKCISPRRLTARTIPTWTTREDVSKSGTYTTTKKYDCNNRARIHCSSKSRLSLIASCVSFACLLCLICSHSRCFVLVWFFCRLSLLVYHVSFFAFRFLICVDISTYKFEMSSVSFIIGWYPFLVFPSSVRGYCLWLSPLLVFGVSLQDQCGSTCQ